MISPYRAVCYFIFGTDPPPLRAYNPSLQEDDEAEQGEGKFPGSPLRALILAPTRELAMQVRESPAVLFVTGRLFNTGRCQSRGT
jgi:hypothetical protein